MKMKLDLSQFKATKKDEDFTYLRHKDGHEFKIANKALHPMNRKNLDDIEMHDESETKMADGGVVKKDKGPYVDPKAAKEVEKGATSSGWQPDSWKKNIKTGLGLAKGGEVPKKGKLDYEKLDKPVMRNPVEYEKIEQPKPKHPIEYEAIKPGEQRFAQGGQPMTPESGIQEPMQPQSDSPIDEFAPGQMPESAGPQTPQPMAPAMPQQSPQAQSLASVAPPALAQDPNVMPDGSEAPTTMNAYKNQAQGIGAQAKAEMAQGEEQAKAAQNAVVGLTQLKQNYDEHYQKLDQERNAFQQDVQDAHINPGRYMGSMTTDQRMQTMVGLILGGVGGGMSGQNNAALDFLNKQIDRDIEAQKADLGKKENLLSANMKQFGNLKEATDMTKVMMHDAFAAKLKVAEAKATSPLAKARAQQQLGALQAATAPIVQKLATDRMIGQFEGEAKQDPSKYPQLIGQLEQIDPKKAADLRERLVPGIGLANTPKDANEVKEISIAASGAKSAIDELRQIAQQTGKSLSPNTRAKAQSIRQQLIGQMRVAILGPGTVNESERKLMENLIPDVSSLMSLDSSNKIKLDALERRMADGVKQNLSARGVAGTSPAQASAPTQEVERVGKDGKVAIFDAGTKKFLRYK